ncbi:MAG: DcrB-related protein, partial [Candidatus Krumholzibacteriota bacterium]|nr:DcrB-related protein [Candidatus Krumholzibacteriota bacterium]
MNMGSLHNQFRFDLPGEWEDQTVFVFRGPIIGESEHKLLVTIDRNPQQDDIREFARDRTSPLVDSLQGLEVLKDEEITLEDGNPAYEFVCKWIPSEEISIIKKYVFVFYDRMGFTFSCDFSKKSYKILGGQMSGIIESFLPGTYQ